MKQLVNTVDLRPVNLSSSLISTPIPTALATSSLRSIDLGRIFQAYNNPQGWALLGIFVGLIILSKVLGSGQGKISTGRTVGRAEQLAATTLALRQIDNLRQLHLYNQAKQQGTALPAAIAKNPPKHNQVTLWCGSPRYWAQKEPWRGWLTWVQTMLGAPPTVFLPDAQRSMLVLGIPGSGKTFSVIDRTIESAFQQGIPVLLYDKKGDQLRLHAPLAARYGYQVHVFAPGDRFSGVLNPIDFVRDGRDAVMAGELAAVINRNASSGGKTDEFFSKAGDMLAKALVQLAKSTPYPDMAMVYAIMKLPNLVKRLSYAIEQGTIDPWIASSFSQFVSSKDAEKTVAGIQTTAAAVFSAFIQADLLPAFMGTSTIPKRIEGKQLIVFKLDDERRTVIGPLLAAALHLCIVSNLSTPRRDPIAIFLDELPSLKLDKLPQWINEYRSNGGCFILGVQSLNQLSEAYGEKMGASIAAACSTHVLFNPGDSRTAEEYSKRYGEKEIKLKNRSTSSSMGQQASRSTSWSESLQKMPLFTVDQILRLPEGHCIIANPGYRSGTEGSVPYPLKIIVPPADLQRAKESEQLWHDHVRSVLEQHAPSPSPTQLTAELQKRIDWAEHCWPLPPEEEEGAGSQQAPSPPVSRVASAAPPQTVRSTAGKAGSSSIFAHIPPQTFDGSR